MSRIDEMLQELCPDGVATMALGGLLDYEQPGKYLVSSTDYHNDHETPVLTAGQTFILGYTNEVDGIYPASTEHPVLIFDDFTTAFRWVDFPFKAKSSAMKMLTTKSNAPALLRYVYFAMQCIRYEPQDHARHWIGKYSHFHIPVPPLEVQREIVRVLDHFSQLEVELEAELEARHRQYQYYRDKLVSEAIGAEYLRLGDVGSFVRGRRFTKDDVVDSGIPSIHYGEIYTEYGTFTNEAVRQVRVELRDQLRYAQPGSVVFAGVGETVADVGKAVAWLGNEPVATHDDTFVFTSPLNPKYVAYAVQTKEFHRQKERHVSRAKVKRLSAAGLADIKIPVPNLTVQERIVETLGNFDALVNDSNFGLPAEISLRRKQYEHYRDRLLTFKEAAA
ncbi:restriction endonuclease subunit S [Streptomyces sp. NPDC002619]|uniref:restriction endonuclease subunit S n=1 Tax=Streptomyces sp. NPDC002619 TaxID=3364655 RepID=UPI0036B78447